MNAEQFHDALTLLPEDLVAQADKFRSRRPKIIPWKRYATVAACFAVLMTSAVFVYSRKSAPTEMVAASYSAAKQEMADAAPQMEATAAEAPMVGTAGTGLGLFQTPSLPNVAEIDRSATIITSRSELETYFTEMEKYYQLDELEDACTFYGEDWFAQNDLLLIPVDSVSPSCTVTDVVLADGVCEVTLTGEKTEEGTSFHIVLPVAKGAVTDTKNITVTYYSDTIS